MDSESQINRTRKGKVNFLFEDAFYSEDSLQLRGP